MSTDKAAAAREGLLDSIAGKAKEVAGAVSGKDDLVEEGQLQQAEASNRKAAVADDAVADAKAREATEELRDASVEATQERGAADREAVREESMAEAQR
jgi:uncharacterized protein YjbJ (UPF0337 family)